MNRWMIGAGALLALTCYVHVFIGGPEIHVPIQGSDLSEYLRAMSAVLWHAITVLLLVFASAAFWVSKRPNPDLTRLMILTQLGFAGLFIYYGLTLLDTLWIMPQWVVFMAVPGLMAMGLRRPS